MHTHKNTIPCTKGWKSCYKISSTPLILKANGDPNREKLLSLSLFCGAIIKSKRKELSCPHHAKREDALFQRLYYRKAHRIEYIKANKRKRTWKEACRDWSGRKSKDNKILYFIATWIRLSIWFLTPRLPDH